MTTPPTFPTLSGLGWSVHKKPVFSTLVASHVSGREVRDALYQNPIWQFELTFDGLDSSATGAYPGLGSQSLQSLMGFFLVNQGQYGTFLYSDPTDNSVTNGAVINPNTGGNNGDGLTTTFTLVRYMGSCPEPVGWVNTLSSVSVAGSSLSSSDWYLSTPNSLVFTNSYVPANGAAITASFTFAFQCRFDSDDEDFEQFMQNLWKADSVKFRSVRTS
jgi:uncharacterized protein (TIGR02217 family)